MEDKLLLNGLKELNLKDRNLPTLGEASLNELHELLSLYMRELKMFNASFNLVKVKDDKELIISHILDSLSAWRFFYDEIMHDSQAPIPQKEFYIADAGTGAGFPGIPLAILFKTLGLQCVNFNLIERMQKRCTFLENVKAVLQLKNTEIIESEAEKAPQVKFDIVTCRAFRTLDKQILNTLLSLARPKGKLFLYKATEEKINEEMELIKKENLNYKIEDLHVPFLNRERRLLIIEKP
ncbi:16S rRNA (guanine(527)-N(7))-methyltransferase RsmG [Treponema sp. OMZ 787]|uniref:16S rRNA (guanine(527)-N(7))-methyltransferase RsmG n=1 Tax=Treponema sp. OMZ 787 TaxID=2563669 RepID=UPI0020A60BAF|nr:16S rRNA (guanine(527)-N(7))-methyltransferase RsmG [Treponema sp. OMZ 787]UTC63110.1 16S rRNA (guanine(527)-N(7))-methyltransferase RsmG [Treponema sp. OMZ 787]